MNGADAHVGFLNLCLLLGLYMLPGLVAAIRGHRNTAAIFLLNLLLGWTILGWIGALVWSVTAQERSLPPPPAP
jgi:hypothetical protein